MNLYLGRHKLSGAINTEGCILCAIWKKTKFAEKCTQHPSISPTITLTRHIRKWMTTIYTQIVENSQMRMWIVHEKCVNVNDKHEMRGQIRKYMHKNDATLKNMLTLSNLQTKHFLPILWVSELVSEWMLCVCIICKRFCAESPNAWNHPYCFCFCSVFPIDVYLCEYKIVNVLVYDGESNSADVYVFFFCICMCTRLQTHLARLFLNREIPLFFSIVCCVEAFDFEFVFRVYTFI